MSASVSAVVFDLDGTLLDSDDALVQAFVVLGVPRELITFGHVVADECARLGVAFDDYVNAYDVQAAAPYPGVDSMLAALPVRWAVCSNKVGRCGQAELDRLGWRPDVVLFAEAFGGPKTLGPVVDRLGVETGTVLFVGDTEHDRACAAAAGSRFALAGWNPRARASVRTADIVLDRPADVLRLL